MAKKYKIVLSVLFVVLVALAAVVVSGVFDVSRRVEQQTESGDNLAGKSVYTDLYRIDTGVALPVLKTTLNGLYYTMSKEGDVSFYEIENGALVKRAETGSFEVEAECSSQTLPAVIHYVEREDGLYGCGLFTNLLYPDVMLYDYGFFQITDMFPGYSSNRLLMIDVDASRFYSNDKVFSEIFKLYDNNNTEHFLSENQRTVDFAARMKTDYKMFTNDILDQGDNGNVLFFSSRYYVDYAESGKLDIFTSGGAEVNLDNVRYVVDIASMHFWRTEQGTQYFALNDAGGFDLCSVASAEAEPEVLASFEGKIDKDYIVDGAYLFSKQTGEVYNVLTGETYTVNYDVFREGFRADQFYISPSGRFCVIRGANTDNVAACGVADLQTGAITAYTNEVFGYLAGAVVEDDGTVVLSIASGESGTSFYQLVGNVLTAPVEQQVEG
ncbi:MAG: hypothetical protein IJT27_02405 [Clostridia bacterium]|nr:hypothetical protein [Clostridia bacterium]